jgi:hypothetical protein
MAQRRAYATIHPGNCKITSAAITLPAFRLIYSPNLSPFSDPPRKTATDYSSASPPVSSRNGLGTPQSLVSYYISTIWNEIDITDHKEQLETNGDF